MRFLRRWRHRPAPERGRAATAERWRGRKLHFIAIGGAGMSGLALVCQRLGARVTGSDRAESTYLARLRAVGLEPRIGHDAEAVPADAEVVVSTAVPADNPELVRARDRGQRVLHRGELLAELCAEKRLLAIGGTHGKTTTAGMLAHALRAIGADPAFLLGGELPGAAEDGGPTNAAWGEGEWIVAEADESDASFLWLRPEVAVITNVELDHHSRWSSRAELFEAFRRFTEPARGVALHADTRLDPIAAPFGEGEKRLLRFGGEAWAPPREPSLAVPGRHNLLNALAALAGAELAGFDVAAACEALSTFPGMLRRLELKGRRDGATVYDDYAHHPTEVSATLAALRELRPRRLIAVFQPHLYSRTKALAREFGRALAAADVIGVLDVYPAREESVGPLAGVSGLDVARAAAELAGGRPVWWLGDAERAERALTRILREGDLLVTIGAGDIFRLAEALVSDPTPPIGGTGGEGAVAGVNNSAGSSASRPGPAGLGANRAAGPAARTGTSSLAQARDRTVPPGVERDFSLARLSTVRTGGPADLFARPGSEEELVRLLAWAEEQGVAVGVVGSGSNLLISDQGFRGLVLKLEAELATIDREGNHVICGGGARLPSAAARAARWGLSRLEFGINIPGTVGGAVKMNANAYGGQLGRVLEWVNVSTASGVEQRLPAELDFRYRRSNLQPGEIVSRASFRLVEGEVGAIKRTLAEMRGRRREAQPSGIKTFGSTFKNPEDDRAPGRTAGQLLDAAGCRGLRVGGARLSEKHANFVENIGDATTADVLGLMAEGRRRVHERFGVALEPEVQVLGEVDWPDAWRLPSE